MILLINVSEQPASHPRCALGWTSDAVDWRLSAMRRAGLLLLPLMTSSKVENRRTS